MDFWALLDLLGQQYPSLIPLLAKPGVFDVVRQAVDPGPGGNWPAAKLQAALEATPYFQQTPQATRTFDVLVATDPATAHQRVADADRMIRTTSGQLGIMPGNDFEQFGFAVQAAAEGWDESRIRMETVARSKGAAALGPGGIGDQMTQYKGLAEEYGVPIADNDLYWWAANTQGGSVTKEGFRDFLTDTAIWLYPSVAPALNQGLTLKQFASPYLEQAAKELGIGSESISLLNPKWNQTFIGTNDKGEQKILNLNESLAKVRTDPAFGYDSSASGVKQAATFAQQIQQQFGATG